MNPYKVLGLEPSASEEEVKEAYREKAKEHHPDQGGDAEKFKEIQKAKEEILDDGFGFSDGPSPGNTYSGGREINFEDLGGFGGPESFGNEKSVEDMIEDFINFQRSGGFTEGGFQGDPFGNQGPFESAQQQADRTPEYPLRIDFETAVFGREVYVPEAGQTVEIPAGVKNGTKLAVGGNFIIRIDVQNTTEFQREGENDLYTVKEVSAIDAMTGRGDIEIETLRGKTIHLSIGPGTSDGDVFRLKGWGGPETFEGAPQGDLYVEASVNVPPVTDEDAVEKLKEANQILDRT